MPECDYCGKNTSLPYTCGYCGGTFCGKHRLPENHECEGLDEISEKSEASDEIYRGVSDELKSTGEESKEEESELSFDIDEDFEPVERRERRVERKSPNIASGLFGMLKNIFFHRVTTIILLIIFVAFIGQQIAGIVYGEKYLYYIAASRSTVLDYPWTIVTSIFAHGGSFHLIINSLILFFIGSTLEKGIGKERFIEIFFIAGVAATAGQILVMTGAEANIPVLGASGAIMGLLGALTILAPRMPILLFFFIPMELWMLTVGYGALETIFAVTGLFEGTGHVAHVTGLAVGLIFGYWYKKQMESKRSGSPSIRVSRY